MNAENKTCFESFGVQHIQKQIKKFIQKNLKHSEEIETSSQIFIEYKDLSK